VTVNASYTIGAAAVPLFIGVEEGFYRAQGLDVHTQVVTNSAAAVAGLTSGQLQFATGAIVTLMQAYSEGIPIELIGPQTAFARGTQCLLARSGTTLAQVHTVALNSLGGTSQLTNEIWMRNRGVSPSTINYIAIPYSGELTALRNGTVDAADIDEPFLAEGLTQGGLTCIGDDSVEAGPYGAASSFWFTSRSFAQQNPQVIEEFADGLLRANLYSGTHPAAEYAADEQITGVTPAEAQSTVFYGYPTAINLGVLQRLASRGYQLGLISTQITVKDMFWPGVRYTRI
jgi:NitT/TauT family transport system substrate-binding protein